MVKGPPCRQGLLMDRGLGKIRLGKAGPGVFADPPHDPQDAGGCETKRPIHLAMQFLRVITGT